MLVQVALLLVGLIIGIVITISLQRKRKGQTSSKNEYEDYELYQDNDDTDDILNIRQPEQLEQAKIEPTIEPLVNNDKTANQDTYQQENILVLNLFAKQNKQFVGYELLQALLATGMRYGDMKIFHRYQEANAKGPILFSLASSVEPGVFDINHMGGFSTSGLTLFMSLSNNSTIDLARFKDMLETARQLADDLDGILHDNKHNLLTSKIVEQYGHRLGYQCSETI